VYEIEARHAVDSEQKIAFTQIADGNSQPDDPDHAYEGSVGPARGSAEPEVQPAIESGRRRSRTSPIW
jgi:hypothetical protein